MEFDGEVFELLQAAPSGRSKRPRDSDSETAESEQTQRYGPTTFEGVASWAPQLCEDMQAYNPGLLKVLREKLSSGKPTVLTTHYSGIGCAELAMLMLEKAADGLKPDKTESNVLLYSACESDPIARKMLMGRVEPFAPVHVFGDIVSRVPLNVLERLRDIEDEALNAAAQLKTPPKGPS